MPLPHTAIWQQYASLLWHPCCDSSVVFVSGAENLCCHHQHFDMIPAASAKFIAQLTALVLKGEKDLLLEVSKGSSRYIVLLYARGYVWQHWLYLHTVCHLVKCARTGKIYEKIWWQYYVRYLYNKLVEHMWKLLKEQKYNPCKAYIWVMDLALIKLHFRRKLKFFCPCWADTCIIILYC